MSHNKHDISIFALTCLATGSLFHALGFDGGALVIIWSYMISHIICDSDTSDTSHHNEQSFHNLMTKLKTVPCSTSSSCCVAGVVVWGRSSMTSAKFWDFWTPSPCHCPTLATYQYYRVLLSQIPSPLNADVICERPLSEQFEIPVRKWHLPSPVRIQTQNLLEYNETYTNLTSPPSRSHYTGKGEAARHFRFSDVHDSTDHYALAWPIH